MAVPALMAATKAAAAASSAYTSIKEYSNTLGLLEDEVIVTVRGTKYSSKKELYKLAAAVAFGKVRKLTASLEGLIPTPGVIMLENNLAEMSVTFTLRYSRSLISIYATNYIADSKLVKWVSGDPAKEVTDVNGTRAVIRSLDVLNGPEDNCIGGAWDFENILFGASSGLSNRLDSESYINTPILVKGPTCTNPLPGLSNVIPTPNPRPIGDMKSRGSLINLVYTAISNPGTSDLMLYPNNRTQDFQNYRLTPPAPTS